MREALPEGRVSDDRALLRAYSVDNSGLSHAPDIVAWPTTEAEVATVVRAANETGTPLCARGRATATTGASLAEQGGIVLSTERMDKIVSIEPAGRTATVEPGVINGDLARELAGSGMLWPPDPSSAPYCTVGGNLATAAAGPRGVKYGGVRENVLAVRAVCGDGSVVASGAAVHKHAAGYDLARLIVGSEGTLAVITQATLKLVPAPAARTLAAATFASSAQALSAVEEVMASPATPSAVEFLDEGCVRMVEGEAGGLGAGVGAALLLAVDSPGEQAAAAEMGRVLEAVVASGGSFASGARGEELWAVRPVLSQRLREVAPVKVNEDVVVPVPELAGLVGHVQKACDKAGVKNVNFGHAGLGNLHVNLLVGEDGKEREAAMGIVADLMERVVGLGGCISGEHGVGIAKRGFMPMQADGATLALMRRVKAAFDPAGIMNPGKVLQ